MQEHILIGIFTVLVPVIIFVVTPVSNRLWDRWWPTKAVDPEEPRELLSIERRLAEVEARLEALV